MKVIFKRAKSQTEAGMTMVEVVVALAVAGLAMASLASGYFFSTTSAERAALSLAANARAMERLEETRCARWNTTTWPVTDELVATNFPDKFVILDLSGSGAGISYATNYTVISQISVTPALRRVRVDCVWQFKGPQLYTNSIETCRSPDQ